MEHTKLVINRPLPRIRTSHGLCVRYWCEETNRCLVLLLMKFDFFSYRPPTKLWEGNVFSHVCLSIHGGSHVTIIHDALDFTIQVSPIRNALDMGPHCTGTLVLTSGGYWSNICAVGKWAVCIQLKCFLADRKGKLCFQRHLFVHRGISGLQVVRVSRVG